MFIPNSGDRTAPLHYLIRSLPAKTERSRGPAGRLGLAESHESVGWGDAESATVPEYCGVSSVLEKRLCQPVWWSMLRV